MIDIVRRYKYLVRDTDRHGNVRWYLRRRGLPKIRMSIGPDSPDFELAYRDAINGHVKHPVPRPVQGTPVMSGSVSELLKAYYKSAAFKACGKRTRKVRRRVLDRFEIEHGSKRARLLMLRHAIQIRDRIADTPGAANCLVKYLRQVWANGIPLELVSENPFTKVAYLKPRKAGGIPQWTSEEVEAFEAYWPVGSKPRLAFALLIYTGQRRSDIIRLGWQHLRDGCLTFTQVKNADRKPVRLSIPVHPELARIIAATPSSDCLTFLESDRGGPFTDDGFGNAFRRWVRAAGLYGVSPHGLRKATSSRLAERGATGHEIMAVTGHQTLKEVDRYTKAAQQKIMAQSGMKKLGADFSGVSHSESTAMQWDKTTAQDTDFTNAKNEVVPRAGIEPATLQFSVACSTN